ncbi:hypothetical protein [Streptomyces collinus]|uniref:hypothetical protein n=1 Tax=Streptomyces collinus TaxID=42684 RepID=UPI00380370AE
MPSPEQSSNRRDAYAAWLTANGINPSHVLLDADVYLDTAPNGSQHIVYEAFHLDAEGRKQVDERGTGVAVQRRTTPLLVDPPDWWEPYRKPTRDDLLTVLGRVQQLAERWKYTGDRKGGPRQELLQALGQHTTPEAP